MVLRPELLDLLACPKCKQAVTVSADKNSLECDHCRLRYPIRDEIPVMLIDEAESY